MEYHILRKKRTKISQDFHNFYHQKGFLQHRPLPLRIDFDPTLNFTSCSICIFKKHKIKNSHCENYVVIQNCLRTNTFDVIHNINNELLWTSSITMLGGYKRTDEPSSVKDFQEALILQAQFLRRWIHDNEIILTIPTVLSRLGCLSNDVLKALARQEINIVMNEDIDSNLRWNYGYNNIYGLGTRWEITDNNTYNWGNVILLFENSSPIGIDFGGGLEVLIQAIYDLKHKIFANSYCTDFIARQCNKSNLHIKLIDTCVTILSIIIETDNLKDANIRIEYILYKYIRALKSILIILDISEEYFDTTIQELIINNKKWRTNSDKINKDLMYSLLEHWQIPNFKTKRRRRIDRIKSYSSLEKAAIEHRKK